jgi:hypothetical protein
MRRLVLTLAFLLLIPSTALATWSIIAIDLNTGRVVIASATCAATGPDQLKLLQAVVVPGVGVAAAQAGTWASIDIASRVAYRGPHAGPHSGPHGSRTGVMVPRLRLSARGVMALKTDRARDEFWDTVTPGLILRVSGESGSDRKRKPGHTQCLPSHATDGPAHRLGVCAAMGWNQGRPMDDSAGALQRKPDPCCATLGWGS